MPTKEEFAEWLRREMPAGTVIGDPDWWATKLYDALTEPARGCGFTWDAKQCPCGDVQAGECTTLGCQWQREPWRVPDVLRVYQTAAPQQMAQRVEPEQCGSRGFAGPSGCTLPKGHEGAHRYGIRPGGKA